MSCRASDSSEPGSHDNDAKHNPTTQTAVALTDMAANRIFETPASSPPNEATFINNNDARTAPAQLSSAQLQLSSTRSLSFWIGGWWHAIIVGRIIKSAVLFNASRHNGARLAFICFHCILSPLSSAVAKLEVAPFRESINPKRLEDQGPGGREKKRSAEER
jgi:hypothetical protein